MSDGWPVGWTSMDRLPDEDGDTMANDHGTIVMSGQEEDEWLFYQDDNILTDCPR